jgi:hypothetical protein
MKTTSESSSVDKSYELPDGNVITVGNERSRTREGAEASGTRVPSDADDDGSRGAWNGHAVPAWYHA